MKFLAAILTSFALLAFAAPAFACDAHKSADKGETTTTSAEKSESDAACGAECADGTKEKKAKAETEEATGES